MQRTSGCAYSSHSSTRGSRALSELTFQVALRTAGSGLRVEVVEPAGHALEDLVAQTGDVAEQLLERGAADHHDRDPGRRRDGRVARRVVEQGELAEEVPRSELRDLALIARHRRLAGADH